MNYTELALDMSCDGLPMVGVLAKGEQPRRLGVVIVVGGPQTRVGSHRQFVLLARCLAGAGYSVLRFDYRGMGDSAGEARSFDAIDRDIAVAVDALQSACPEVQQVVLWGLCDGASAALLYSGARHDVRITGLCLLNPWVRSQATLARTHLKHHYAARVLQVAFWRKLLSGRLDVVRSLRELLDNIRASRSSAGNADAGADANLPFQARMALALREFTGQVLLVLSANDYTAQEFLDTAQADPAWRGLMQKPGLQRVEVAGADHTFSKQQWRLAVEKAVLNWLETIKQ
jgi:exosortase A-associated hydrolase 1